MIMKSLMEDGKVLVSKEDANEIIQSLNKENVLHYVFDVSETKTIIELNIEN